VLFVVALGVGASFTLLYNNKESRDIRNVYLHKQPLGIQPEPLAKPRSLAVLPEYTANPTIAAVAPSQPLRDFNRKQTPAPGREGLSRAVVRSKLPEKPITRPESALPTVVKIAVEPFFATVSLDGHELSPYEMKEGKSVISGPHEILAKALGFEEYQSTFNVEPHLTQIVAISLTHAEKGTGLLHVYSYPWSDFYVDGVLQGTTPTPKPLAFLEGEHELLLQRQGFKPYSQIVRIAKGQVTHVQVQLEKFEPTDQ
jgi:hypothetical protein